MAKEVTRLAALDYAAEFKGEDFDTMINRIAGHAAGSANNNPDAVYPAIQVSQLLDMLADAFNGGLGK